MYHLRLGSPKWMVPPFWDVVQIQGDDDKNVVVEERLKKGWDREQQGGFTTK